jgi:hypothetical protein
MNMPRMIRYVKQVGTLKVGDTEERSDIDANILIQLGVAEEGTAVPASPVKTVVEQPTFASRAEQRRSERGGRKSKKDKKEERKEGYKRRDMVAERRP